MELLARIRKISGIIDLINEGGEIYLVGGCVRDNFLNTPIKDIDLVVRLLKQETIVDILEKTGNVDLVGESFGIIKYKPFGSSEDFDIAMPREDFLRDSSLGHRGIGVKFNETICIETDLKRRDFTINSIAMGINGEIIDPFNGLLDIKDKRIRATSLDAFGDDPLRMLRAIQFASRFDFEIDKETWKLISVNSKSISTISPERYLIEFDKIYTKGNIRKGIYLLILSGLYYNIFKKSFNNKYDICKVKSREDFYTVLCGDDITFIDKLRGDINTAKGIRAINSIKNNTRLEFFDAIYISKTIMESGFYFELFKDFQDNNLPTSYRDLSVDGYELIKKGFNGKEIGDELRRILLEILLT